MKLAFLIYSYFPYGGQQRDFFRIAKECISHGHNIVVYTLKWQGDLIEGADVKMVPISAQSRTRLYSRYTQWVLNELQKNPVDLVFGFNKMPGLDVYFAADPCFAEKADLQRAAYYRFTPRYRHFKTYEEAVFGANSDTRVLILSQLQRQAFEKYYPDCSSRLTQVPPGIDPDRKITDAAPVTRKKLRKELNLDDDKLLIVQIGSGFRVKGVDRSLRAIASLPEQISQRVTYLLVGQDRPGRYLRLASRLGIADRFKVLPGRDDIPRFLLAADLLLHPAYGESAGYVLLEATIAGLPILTTAACGYAFHVEKAGSGLVCTEPFSQSELNDKLHLMLTSPDKENWHQRGIEYGKQEELFTMSKAVVDYLEELGTAITT